ncbi:Uncharacterized protein Fot_03439 [Forsythia ovata]|uniref:Uncharacterized protein n=1 Tax=Forsythia ovata TaxID=205694 RepID=A0ABD1XAL9_9LAMI
MGIFTGGREAAVTKRPRGDSWSTKQRFGGLKTEKKFTRNTTFVEYTRHTTFGEYNKKCNIRRICGVSTSNKATSSSRGVVHKGIMAKILVFASMMKMAKNLEIQKVPTKANICSDYKLQNLVERIKNCAMITADVV